MSPDTTRGLGSRNVTLARRTTAVTAQPAAMPCETICLPVQPLAPSTTIFMVNLKVHEKILAAAGRDGRAVFSADDDFHAAIQLPTARIGIARHREFLAVTLVRDARGVDSSR